MLKSKCLRVTTLLFIIAATAGCGISRQTREIKALEDCKYRIAGADKITLAGTDVRKIIKEKSFDLASLPGIALGLLNKDIPLRVGLSLEITNPTANLAAINQFEYKLLVGDSEIANGVFGKEIRVSSGQKTLVPVNINSNVYSLLSNSDILNGVIKAVKQRTGSESLGALTIKLKPTFMIGKSMVKYPGYITITKEINTGMFL